MQIVNKHMKRCSASLIIREIQIEITMRYHLTLVRMVKKIYTHNKCWKRCEEKSAILHYWWKCKLIQPLWRTMWRFLKKLGINLPNDLATSLLSIYPENTTVLKDTCTWMFIAAIFAKPQTWMQPRCPSTGDWIK